MIYNFLQTSIFFRLKPPTVKKSHKDVLNDSPYDVGLSVDLDKKRKKINQQLHLEKKEFMSKLNITRMVRTKLENDAAKRIQSIFRGFSVRNSLDEIRYYCSIFDGCSSSYYGYYVTICSAVCPYKCLWCYGRWRLIVHNAILKIYRFLLEICISVRNFLHFA